MTTLLRAFGEGRDVDVAPPSQTLLDAWLGPRVAGAKVGKSAGRATGSQSARPIMIASHRCVGTAQRVLRAADMPLPTTGMVRTPSLGNIVPVGRARVAAGSRARVDRDQADAASSARWAISIPVRLWPVHPIRIFGHRYRTPLPRRIQRWLLRKRRSAAPAPVLKRGHRFMLISMMSAPASSIMRAASAIPQAPRRRSAPKGARHRADRPAPRCSSSGAPGRGC